MFLRLPSKINLSFRWQTSDGSKPEDDAKVGTVDGQIGTVDTASTNYYSQNLKN